MASPPQQAQRRDEHEHEDQCRHCRPGRLEDLAEDECRPGEQQRDDDQRDVCEARVPSPERPDHSGRARQAKIVLGRCTAKDDLRAFCHVIDFMRRDSSAPRCRPITAARGQAMMAISPGAVSSASPLIGEPMKSDCPAFDGRYEAKLVHPVEGLGHAERTSRERAQRTRCRCRWRWLRDRF